MPISKGKRRYSTLDLEAVVIFHAFPDIIPKYSARSSYSNSSFGKNMAEGKGVNNAPIVRLLATSKGRVPSVCESKLVGIAENVA